MISFTNFISLILFLQVIAGAPVAKLITRVHTADPVTTTNTYTTGTTTVNLPPVEIFISNGVTYTFTLNDQPAGTPTTTTSVYTDDSNNNDDNKDNNNVNAQAQATPQTTAQTTAQTTTAATTTSDDNNNNNSPDQTTSQTANQTPAPTTDGSENESPTVSSTSTDYTPDITTAPTDSSETTGQETTENTSTTSSSTDQETTSSDSETTASSGSISAPTAIAYSPYADDGGCKDSSTIKSDLKLISGKGISKIRIYGTDCGLYDTIFPTAKDLGMKINQGFWISDAGVDSIDDAVSEFIEWASDNGFDTVDFITVGNEAINSNYCSVSDLIAKIKSVKSKLQSAGYNGKVTTSEPPAVFVTNPSLCKDSNIDFVGINPHSYFDTEIGAESAGWYVTSEKKLVAGACNMDVVITETGYPSQGSSYGKNTPSVSNQEIALKSIIEKTNGEVTILSTFDDMWKHPGPHGIEQYFGAITLFN